MPIEAPRPVPPAKSAAGRIQAPTTARRWIADADAAAAALAHPLARIAPHLLCGALGLVYIWFGALKIAGHSPVAPLIAATLPFANPHVTVAGMGVIELLLGAALFLGRVRRIALLACLVHLAGTFLTFVTAPHLMVAHRNPTLLTNNGEFVLKNLVLMGAALTLATHHSQRTPSNDGPTVPADRPCQGGIDQLDRSPAQVRLGQEQAADVAQHRLAVPCPPAATCLIPVFGSRARSTSPGVTSRVAIEGKQSTSPTL